MPRSAAPADRVVNSSTTAAATIAATVISLVVQVIVGAPQCVLERRLVYRASAAAGERRFSGGGADAVDGGEDLAVGFEESEQARGRDAKHRRRSLHVAAHFG